MFILKYLVDVCRVADLDEVFCLGDIHTVKAGNDAQWLYVYGELVVDALYNFFR